MRISKENVKKFLTFRKVFQFMVLPVFFGVIAFGWKYPWLGFVVPLVMLTGIIGALFKGRYVCGNLCPRGSFFDRVWQKVSLKKEVPSIFRKKPFKIGVLIFLIFMLTFQISKDPSNPLHWGYTFWLICFVTSIVGIILGFIFYPRTWCTFCPVGSLGTWINTKRKNFEFVREKCKECLICEKNCPMNLKFVKNFKNGKEENPECILCYQCIVSCPFGVLKIKI